MKLKITVLTENVASGKLLAEHGLSYLVEIDGEKILFDTGHSDVYLKNARQLGIDVENDVKKVVLSHGHHDHGDGLQYIENKTLITHPGSFSKRFRKKDRSPVGLQMTESEIREKFRVIESGKSFQVTENLFFLGEISRLTSFEGKTTTFEFEDGTDDFVEDDSALAAVVNNKLVVITGCSHSGICNICEQARKVTGIDKLKAVIGGFHLKLKDRQTLETIDYFRQNHAEQIFPSHCTEIPAFLAFYNEFHCKQVKTGMIFEFQ